MMIATAGLFIIMFLSVIDGAVTSKIVPPAESKFFKNTKLAIFNRNTIQLQSNYYSQYPLQVINEMIMTNNNDVVNSTMHRSTKTTDQSVFRLLLPPRDYDDTLCTPVSPIMIDEVELQQTKIGDIADSLYPTGLFIRTDNTIRDNNCTLSSVVSNAIELNRILPESESIRYLIFSTYSNVSYGQIDTIINQTNNNITSDELFAISNNITIAYLELSYEKTIMKMIQNGEFIGCSPFLLEPENITTCNFIYQLMNDTSGTGQSSSASFTFIAMYAYRYIFFAILVIVGLVSSCLYHRRHPGLLAVTEQIPSTAIEKEKTPTKLTENQFESLPVTKYTLDLIDMLKKYGNDNVTNTTVLDDSTAMNITSSMEQPTKDEMIVQLKDCVSKDMTNTIRINDNDQKKLKYSSCHNNMSDVEEPLQTTIQSDNRDNTDISDADECGVCCPICIEEFVVDEIVIVLPKCNHVYHNHCIREWLMKKQGCCPYCKVLVIDVVVDDNTKNNENQVISDLDNV